MEAGICSSGSPLDEIIETVTKKRGWHFKHINTVKALILPLLSNYSISTVESELANLDLRSYGGKALPDIRNCSHISGPIVLQVASARDISRSCIDDNSGNSHKRLLRLNLTDGHSEITAIEYSPVPSIPSDIVPGTKVRLENKAPIHCGIVCLTPKVITVIGGVVQSLHEEWQMNKKYSGFSRSSLKMPKESDADSGRPTFEKLQISSVSRSVIQARMNHHTASVSKSYKPAFRGKDPGSDPNPTTKFHEHDRKVDNVQHNRNTSSNAEKTEESASNSNARAKEVVEFVPPQNQVAAQKLLQKMSRPKPEYHSRGRKYRGKESDEDTSVLTLDEWERKKAGANPSLRDPFSNASQDEDLARQLQDQFDLEDHHVLQSHADSEAERLRMSMFNFQRNDDRGYDRESFRGRGRGRRRGRGGGR